jgi:hypothetical protein
MIHNPSFIVLAAALAATSCLAKRDSDRSAVLHEPTELPTINIAQKPFTGKACFIVNNDYKFTVNLTIDLREIPDKDLKTVSMIKKMGTFSADIKTDSQQESGSEGGEESKNKFEQALKKFPYKKYNLAEQKWTKIRVDHGMRILLLDAGLSPIADENQPDQDTEISLKNILGACHKIT